ncbi:MAG: hypothetical protein GX766_02815 [Firmicutes bacterium]|nr:hypothetical protein [Bacillota bacterium]
MEETDTIKLPDVLAIVHFQAPVIYSIKTYNPIPKQMWYGSVGTWMLAKV